MDAIGGVDANVAIRDALGVGPRISQTLRYTGPFNSAEQALEITYAMDLTLRICVVNCTKPKTKFSVFLSFTGQISARIIIGGITGAAVTIGGALVLSVTPSKGVANGGGAWYKAFGLDFLHLSSVVAGVQFDAEKFPTPDSVLVGAAFCLGKEAHCRVKDTDSSVRDKIIDFAGYASFDPNVPANNYFIIMVKQFKLKSVFNAMGPVLIFIYFLYFAVPGVGYLSVDTCSATFCSTAPLSRHVLVRMMGNSGNSGKPGTRGRLVLG